jgi:hypothetical protein
VEYKAIATDGAAKVEVKTEDIQSAVQTAAQKGDAALAVVVSGAETARHIEALLPKSAVSEVQGAKLELTLNTPVAAVAFSGAALATLSAAAGDTVQIVLSSTVSPDGKPAVDLNVYAGDAAVREFGGQVTVSLPYVPETGIRSGDYDLLTVYSVNEDGSLQEVRGAKFNPVTGVMLFAAAHFSTFIVSEWISPFADITKDDWFYRAVRYSYSNGLMGGTGEAAFSPGANLTRAMLITILAREAGAPVGVGDTWYAQAAEWGVANEITDGTNMTDDVTREQMAAILYRYAKLKSQLTDSDQQPAGDWPAVDLKAKFHDADTVSDWAFEAVSWANAAGILGGRAATELAPLDTATRAEAAAILQRFIESGAGAAA